MFLSTKLLLFFSLLVLSVFYVPVHAADEDDDDADDELPPGTPDLPPTADKLWPRNPATGFIEVPVNYNFTHYGKRKVVLHNSNIFEINFCFFFSSLESIATAEIDNFRQGLLDIERKTCIRFVTRTSKHKDYIYVRDDKTGKCNSKLFKVGGRQFINFSPSCMRVRKKCVHETIHALGFRHMVRAFCGFLPAIFHRKFISSFCDFFTYPAPTFRSRHCIDHRLG